MIRFAAAFGVVALLLASSAATVRAQGVVAPSAGPINSGMAGASTAAPVDFGASYWNPAVLSGLESQEFLLGSSLAFPSIHVQNSVRAGSILGVFPPTDRVGLSRSDSGVPSGLATGVAFRLSDDSPMTFGLGVFGLVGGGVNFAGSFTNPVLTPHRPPEYFGFGPIYANTALLAITPMTSFQVTDRLAIGGGPVISSGTVSFSPAFFAPGPKDELGISTFPAATNARPFWGGGFQLGLFYELNDDWNLGFSYKSPVWQEPWAFNAAFPDLAPRRISVQADIPAIYSWGVAYKGIPNALIDVDVRYFDYTDTELFGENVRDGGLGWRSVFAVATGMQYRLTDRLNLLAGYLYNTNPINETQTLFNVQAPGIIVHTLTVGASLRLTENITFTTSWMHGFRNAIEGPILQLPGSSTKLDMQLDTFVAGLNITFGGKRRDPRAAQGVETAMAHGAAE